MATTNVIPFTQEPTGDLLAEIVRRRSERLAAQGKAYARTVPIASDCDPDSCARRQVLEIVRWQDKPVPDAERQARFEAGLRAEDDIIIDLKRDGFRVVQEQVPFELKHRLTGEVCLRGKIDGKIHWQVQDVPFEIKSAHPNIFAAINTAEDWERFWWTRKYPPQLQAYLVGHGHPWGVWLLTDCLGNWKLFRADLDYALAERIWSFAESIVNGVRAYNACAGVLPAFTRDATQCAHCDFFGRTCNPDTIEQGAAMLSDPELEAQGARWYELRDPYREYNGLDKRVKDALKKALPAQPEARGIVGRFAVLIKDKAVKAEEKPRAARTDRVITIEELIPASTAGGGAQ